LRSRDVLWYRGFQKNSRATTLHLIRSLDWDTVLFLIGIFIVLGAVTEVGLLDRFAAFLSVLVGQNVLLGFIVIVLVSTLISGFVDNVPYIIIMLPVAAKLSAGLSLQPELYMFGLLDRLLPGGNLTPFGASANVVSVGILKKQDINLRFADWLKIGLPFTLLTTLASSLFIWIIWR